jgi:hypothetical protein
MIKRSTWITLIILVLLVAGYLIIRSRGSTNEVNSAPTATAISYLITPEDGTLQSLRISDLQSHTTKLQRDTQGTWIITQPEVANADISKAGAIESQVQALRIVTVVENALNPQDVGLDSPKYTIELTFSGGNHHLIEVGAATPINNGYYVRFDSGTVYVVAEDGIDSLANLITTPPYEPTSTPSSTMEISPTSTLDTETPSETSTLAPVSPTP